MTQQKVAIVTGGSNGIGAEIALHLLARNMRVVIADINSLHKEFDLKILHDFFL